MTAELTLSGLGLNLLGVILLFRYGMPFRVRSGGMSSVVVPSDDSGERARDIWYGIAGMIGLLLIIAGTGAQAVAVLVTEGVIFA